MLVLERLLPFFALLVILGSLVWLAARAVQRNSPAGQVATMTKQMNKQLAKADHASRMGRTLLAEEYLAIYHDTRAKVKELERGK